MSVQKMLGIPCVASTTYFFSACVLAFVNNFAIETSSLTDQGGGRGLPGQEVSVIFLNVTRQK